MATTLNMANRLGALRPAQGQDAETWGHMKIAEREVVKVQISRPRNLPFHNKFFAMLGIIYKNQEHYKSIKELLGVCKISIGHVIVVETPQGVERWPDSISFANMDNAGFDEFYNKAVDWVLADVIPGLARQHLDEEVEAKLTEFAG